MNNKAIGDKIKQARLEAGLSQNELGDKIGVTWEMISRYENGRSSSHKHLDKLAEILDKPIAYFVGNRGSYEELYINKIKALLNDKNFGYAAIQKAPIFESFLEYIERGLTSDKNISYDIPSWITSKYSHIFVFRSRFIDSKVVEIGPDDVIILTATNVISQAQGEAYILVVDSNGKKLEIIKKSAFKEDKYEYIGKVIYIERRYDK